MGPTSGTGENQLARSKPCLTPLSPVAVRWAQRSAGGHDDDWTTGRPDDRDDEDDGDDGYDESERDERATRGRTRMSEVAG
jgi:hypothetical protein